MLDRVAKHLDRLLAERDEHGVSTAERIADKLVECSLAGDAAATRIILDALESYDPCLAGDEEWENEYPCPPNAPIPLNRTP